MIPYPCVLALASVASISAAGAENGAAARSARLGAQIARLEQALPDAPESMTRASLTLELAQLHRARSLLAAVLGDQASKQADLQAAIRLSRDLLSRFPKYPDRDRVLLFLASCLADAGLAQEAAARDRELLRDYPDSRLAPDAALQAGDIAFDAKDLAQARKDYHQALASPDPRAVGYALYKLAWCAFSAGDDAQAIRGFQRVVAYEDDALATGPSAGRAAALQLKNQALQDMAHARDDQARRAPPRSSGK